MTAPTSPGVVPADDVRELVERLRESERNYREYGAMLGVSDMLIRTADMLERLANRPSLTENEKADGRSNAVEAFRAWFFAHTGKRIFHANAGKAVDTVLRALADRSEPRQKKEGSDA